MSHSKYNRFLTLLMNASALLILIWPALVNGFPLLYSDSGTYLIAWHWGIVPIDRPVAYSVFLGIFAKLFNVWLLPLVQGLMVLWLSYLSINKWLAPKSPTYLSAVLIAVTGIFTGLPHHVSQLMPDLFTPFLFLCSGTLFFSTSLSRIQKWLLGFVLLFITAMHSTHVVLMLVLVPSFSLLFWIKSGWKKGLLVLVWAFPVLLVVPTLNLMVSGRFYFSDSSRVFLTASLLNSGVLNPWLKDHCEEDGAPKFLCEKREELLSMNGNDLLWGSDVLLDSNCLIEGGWGNCWRKRNEELHYLSSNWWRDKNGQTIWLDHAFKALRMQLLDYTIGMISAQKEGTAPYAVLADVYPKDLIRYRESNQFQNDLYFYRASDRQRISVLVSLVVIIATVSLLYWTKEKRLPLLGLLTVLGTFLLTNAAICGVFSNVLDRYQARIIWLIPFFAIFFCYHLLELLVKTKKLK